MGVCDEMNFTQAKFINHNVGEGQSCEGNIFIELWDKIFKRPSDEFEM